ncbi:M48 family metalloprotease [Desulfobulbus alkaliphilus]|uniref:M48 family metalloprotease n=1 Tax=Desulfobulbus alkaliphilus TaxID=869814 RepID=UPI001963647A|nr:M48 family metalloprotease [Desulfobulbus alkaliphilus]MBM9536712.1 M48 family metalloprotease [Desulfobulbus alkaliphilus]
MIRKKTDFNRRQILQLMGLGAATLLTSRFLTGCAVSPVTGERHLMMISESQEISLDRQQSPHQFSADYGVVQDRNLNAYIDGIGRQIAANSHRPQMPFSFRAVNAAYINAYAFPGGSIAVTRGILVELESEAALAALLGHEIGHVCARHSARQVSKGLLADIFVTGASVATSAAGYQGATDLVQGLGALSAGALLARYSRDNEREADALGMAYMTRTGYSPEGMVQLMEMLQRSGRNQASAIELMFATHPMSTERLTQARMAAQTTYQQLQRLPVYRDRYMDNTASVRRDKPLITALQQGSAAMGKKQHQQAERHFQEALRLRPGDYAALVMMAKCQLVMDRNTAAERYALEATRVYPREAQAHIITGITSIINRKYNQAIHHLGEYDRLLPGNPEVLFYQGYSWEQMNHRRQAADHYIAYLRKRNQGQRAQYAHNRLREWGYIR